MNDSVVNIWHSALDIQVLRLSYDLLYEVGIVSYFLI